MSSRFSSKLYEICSYHSSFLLKDLLDRHLVFNQIRFIYSRKKITETHNKYGFNLFHHQCNKQIMNVTTMQDLQRNQVCKKHTIEPMKNFTSVMNVGEADGWLNIGPYSVFAWSVAGVESCVVVKSDDIQVVFDIGITPKESVKVPNVFITHGHLDHIGSLINHVSKRMLFNMKPARYFVPPHLVEPIKTMIAAHYRMAEIPESSSEANILPFAEEETVKLNSNFFVKSFPTIHRVPSQGYILYKQTKVLKDEYRGLEGFEVAALHRQGTDIHDIVTTPEIAYTGDTLIDVFKDPPTPDLLQVKLLITESTFLDENDKIAASVSRVEKARSRGHIHLVEIAQNAQLFDDVGHILLVHFSSKYSPKYICDSIRDKLPAELRAKVTPATVAANTRPTSYL